MPDLLVIEIILSFDEALILRSMLKDCAQAPINSRSARDTAMKVLHQVDDLIDPPCPDFPFDGSDV